MTCVKTGRAGERLEKRGPSLRPSLTSDMGRDYPFPVRQRE